jgi:hypothetical protein
MLISKLQAGLLCLDTPQGLRYIRPTFFQKLHLVWVFRNFKIVPINVLSQPQAELIETLRNEGPYVQLRRDDYESVVLGTIEYPPHAELPAKKSPQRFGDAVAFNPSRFSTQRVSGISSRQTSGD